MASLAAPPAGAAAEAPPASLARELNGLVDADRGLRRRSLDALSARLLRGEPGGAGPPQGAALQAAADAAVPALARVLSEDAVEKHRELATALLAALLAAAPDPAPLLAVALPALAARAAAGEPSEELRLAQAEVVRSCAERRTPGLERQAGPACAVACAALRDAFPDAVKAGAAGAAALCAALPRDAVTAHAEALAAALGAALAHRHAAVRAAAARGLEALGIAAGSAQLAAERLVPLLRPLFFDAQPPLRAAAVAAAAAWTTALQQPLPPGEAAASLRAFGLDAPPRLPMAPHLLPLLLLATSDEHPGVASAAAAAVEAAADAWAGGNDDAEMADVADDAPCASDAALWLPPPFAARPSARARAMAAALLPALLGPALADLREWTPGVRSAAARLLLASLIHAESAAVGPLPRLLPAIAAGCGDDDAATAGRCVSCAHVLGARTPPAAWLPLAAEAATSAAASPAARTCAVLTLAAMLRTAGGRLPPPLAAAAAAALAAPPLRAAAAEHAPLRAQAAAAARNLALSAGDAAAQCAPALFHLIVSLRGSGGGSGGDPEADGIVPRQQSVDDAAADARADEALAALAAAAGRDPASLYAEHAGAALDAIRAEAAAPGAWAHAGAPGLAALSALLANAPGEALSPHGASIAALLAAAVAAERPPGVRLAALRSLGALADDASGRGVAALRGAAAAPLLRDVLPPLLAWRAGRAAAACRFAALAAAEAMLRRQAASADDVAVALLAGGSDASGEPGPGLLRGLGSCLDEDYYAETRLCAAMALDAALRCGGTLGVRGRHRGWLSQQLARRLDDARDDVRCAAAAALRAFCAALPPPLPPGTADAALLADEWPEAEGAHLLAAVLPHLDDAAAAVRAAAAAAACAAAARHPRAAAELVPPARAAARHPEAYDDVIAAARAAG